MGGVVPVAERDPGALHLELRGASRGAPVEYERRPSIVAGDHLDLAPTDTSGRGATGERLERGFLGGNSSCEMLHGQRASGRIGAFGIGKQAAPGRLSFLLDQT